MNSEQETINLRREENELNLSDLFHISWPTGIGSFCLS